MSWNVRRLRRWPSRNATTSAFLGVIQLPRFFGFHASLRARTFHFSSVSAFTTDVSEQSVANRV